MQDDGEEVVGLGTVHGGGAQNIFADEVDIFLRRGAFEDAAEQRVAVGGIVEWRAGLREERDVGEGRERFFHGGEVVGGSFWGNARQYFWTGASSARSPRSYSLRMATAVIDLEMDPRR